MKSQPSQQSSQPNSRHDMYLAVACSLLGMTQAHCNRQPLAFTTPKMNDNRERESEVRLFSRGPDTLLSVATLAYTGEDYRRTYGTDAADVLDPFDPSFRPSFESLPWGPSPTAVTAPGTTAAAAATLPLNISRDDGQFKIFCDLDGVLVDFEAGVQKITRKSPSELVKTDMWRKIAQSNTAFFAELPWMPDGPKLWKAIRHLKPDILTGVPDLEGSRTDKFAWCRKHLGMQDYRHVDMAGNGYNHANVNGISKAACPERESDVTSIITCWSYNKHHESGQHAVLIDDRIDLKESWEAKGGIFVYHTDADSTLRKLNELGIFF